MPRVSYYTGKYASRIQGVREDILSRCLTSSGERWWRERYGSHIFALLRGNITPGVLEELRSEIFSVLEPSRDKYVVSRVDIEVRESQIFVTVRAVLLPERHELADVSFSLGAI